MILEVKNLEKRFPVRVGPFRKKLEVHAVQDVSFSLRKGETLGLVGESGCGKSTLGRCILNLIKPTSGEVIFDGQEITKLPISEMIRLRRKIQIIFQDPYSSLNPRMSIGSIIEEPLVIHKLHNTDQKRKDRVVELLELVGLRPEVMYRFPHEFSGGQRQRVGIARALAVEPELIVCDEPVSALDVSIQAQVINLLMDLQAKFDLTYLFIAHDLKVVEHISHRVAVMYLGKIVEIGDYKEIYANPQHPYTKALLSAVPNPDPTAKKDRIILAGDPPKATQPPKGCQFHPRCFMAEDLCSQTKQELRAAPGVEQHKLACSVVLASN